MTAEVRNLLFLRSFDWQTWQLHPKIGTPVLVPEPNIVILFSRGWYYEVFDFATLVPAPIEWLFLC